MYIGGSYLYFDGEKVWNLYCLTCPDGKAFYHGKDVPTVLEELYYEAGDENKIACPAVGNVGICMCWEMMRYYTVRCMQGKVNFVMAGSC